MSNGGSKGKHVEVGGLLGLDLPTINTTKMLKKNVSILPSHSPASTKQKVFNWSAGRHRNISKSTSVSFPPLKHQFHIVSTASVGKAKK
jgi:hypothetical protein